MAASVGLSSRSASAYCRTTTAAAQTQRCTDQGSPLFWRNACRGVHLDTSKLPAGERSAAVETLEGALGQWNQAPCPAGGNASIELAYLGTPSLDRVGYREGDTNENAIFFRTDDWPYAEANQIALTTLTFRSDNGEIIDADIEVNSTLQISTTRPVPDDGFDLATVFSHELGHVLGLAHSNERGATMFPTYTPGSTEQGTLKADDREGLCSIYPPDGTRIADIGAVPAAECDYEADPLAPPSEGCNCSTSAASRTGGSVWLTLLGLVVFRWRGRRTRTPQ